MSERTEALAASELTCISMAKKADARGQAEVVASCMVAASGYAQARETARLGEIIGGINPGSLKVALES